MCADQHLALSEDYDDVPGLTLVLPGDLGKDEILTGVVQAIGQVRTQIAARALQFRNLAQGYAAGGDSLSQALCRGQALCAEHVIAVIDESIVEVFVLWDQYAAQCPPGTGEAPGPARPPGSPDAIPDLAPGQEHC